VAAKGKGRFLEETGMPPAFLKAPEVIFKKII